MRFLPHESDSDSEDQDGTTQQLGFGSDNHTVRFRVGATIILLGAVLLVVASLLRPAYNPIGIPKSETNARHPLDNTWSPTAAQLIESRELSEAVGQLAACSVEEGTKLQQSAGVNAEQELPLQWRKQLKFAVEKHYHAAIQQLSSAHQELHTFLGETRLNPSQTSEVLKVLHSLTDSRVLAIGVKVGRSCTTSTREEFEQCAVRNLAPFAVHIRKLREELLPASLRVVNDKLRKRHLHVLHQRGFFHLSGDTDGWHAEASIKANRILQESSSSKKPQMSTSLLNAHSGKPQVSTSLLNVHSSNSQATLSASLVNVQTSSPLPGRSTLAQPPPGAQGLAPSITPVNWFTVGAPAVSTVIGLLSLCLMALLPGTGGFPVNRAANYGLWGLQGAATVGECLANIGFPHGVVYFASCIIDVLFLGLEVIWVFFDGRAVSGPQRITTCSSYAVWVNITGACGNCMATTTSNLGADNCNAYCGTFGHRCKFAAVAVADSCFAKGTYSCGERIPAGVRMLCQCSSGRRLQTERAKIDPSISQNTQTVSSSIVDSPVPPPKLQARLPEGPQERHLQGIWAIPNNSAQLSPFQCIHAETFLVVTVANQTNSSSDVSPMVNFLVAGVWTDPVPVFTAPTTAGEKVTTRLLLAQQPIQMQLVADRSVDNQWGYKRIVLRTFRATATILDTANGAPLANNDFWIGTAPARDRQVYDIPTTLNSTLDSRGLLEQMEFRRASLDALTKSYVQNLVVLQDDRRARGITTTTTTPPTTMTTTSAASSATYYLEIQTANERRAGTGSGVLVQFLLGSEWTAPMEFAPGFDTTVNARGFPSVNGQPIVRGDCTGRTFSLPMRPTEVRLIDNPVDPGLFFRWVYTRVVLVEGPDFLLTVLGDQEPPLRTNATQLSFYFNGSGVGTQVYSVPMAPTQTSTTTTATTTSSTTTTVTVGSQQPPSGPISCSPYVAWPNITGNICGACRALVSSQCSDYCQGFNHVCLHAALPGAGFCQQRGSVNCDRRPAAPTENMLCTCGLPDGMQGPQPRCSRYSQWPAIGVEICGNCKAVVQAQPAGSTTSSCQSFCQSHGHNCESAAVRSFDRTTPCTEARPLGCMDSTAGLVDFLCTCVNI